MSATLAIEDPVAHAPATTPLPRGAADTARPGHARRLERADRLGSRLAELVGDPPAFAAALRSAFAELAEPDYRIGQQRVAPGIGLTHGVRLPYQAALRRALRKATKRDPASVLILVADRLLREPELEARWLAMSILERTVLTDPERSWQLLRRAAGDAEDWITVDTLAHPCGKGILRESYRWAELEQLTISPSRWERRLVGSTIATIPFVDRTAGRAPTVAVQALPLLGLLIGDREPDVQKALAWAYRSLTLVDLPATTAALDGEATIAADTADGNRAWVIRDALPKLAPADAERIRARLDGVRRRPGGPSTSRAAYLAERFAGMGLGRPMPEPPL
jgi:3-methyladenine DNA glycosylase AlkD